MGFDVFPVDST